ncbi:unnamed protein product [Rhizoctonia solani]|uniref:Uncharacterized protein n=1 Tax=Rhizoctonia solani TaxID=456999 RepID=A0A8H3C8L9_9AGAM|nr:unnamed protein product [Rhizoctonia solani]
MAIRFTQEQRNTMDGAYIMAGRNKPEPAVMNHIAHSFGCSLDRIKEYFKYLNKKSKKSHVGGDNFKHHPLSSSYLKMSQSPQEQGIVPIYTSPSPTQQPRDVADELMDELINFPEHL